MPAVSLVASVQLVTAVHNARADAPPCQYDVAPFTVKDKETNLEWQRGHSSADMNWREAAEYCNSLSLADRDDWRLPTVRELATIVDPTAAALGARATISSQFEAGRLHYWSSTPVAGFTDRAWVIQFSYGGIERRQVEDNEGTPADIRVRCVR